MRAARPRASHDLSRSFSTGVWSFELRPRPCTMSTQRCPSATDSARKRSTATRAVADVMPGEVTAAEPAEHARVEPDDRPLDVLARVADVEAGSAPGQVGERG